MFKASKLNYRRLSAMGVISCCIILAIGQLSKMQPPSTNGKRLDAWLGAIRRKVLTLDPSALYAGNRTTKVYNNSDRTTSTTAVRSPIVKPPLYPEGFRLNNLDNFTFTINNDVCGDAVVDIVMVVTSNSRHPSFRAAIRSALPQATLEELRIRRVFLLAQLPPPADKNEYDKRLAAQHAENHEHGDLVSGSFQDTYRNLTYKHLMGLHWASAYCPQAPYILKVDHDIALDVFRLRDRLTSVPATMTAIGMVMNGTGPIRKANNKWYVSKSEFSEDKYPAYMSGGMYLITQDAAAALVTAAREEPFFWVDDAFVTGIIRQRHVPKLKFLDITQLWGQTDDTGKRTSLYTLHIDCIYQCAVDAESTRKQCDTLVGLIWENQLVLRLFMKQAEHCYRHGCQRRRHMPEFCHDDTSRERSGMPQSEADIGDVS